MGLANPQLDGISNGKWVNQCTFECSIFEAYPDK